MGLEIFALKELQERDKQIINDLKSEIRKEQFDREFVLHFLICGIFVIIFVWIFISRQERF